MRYPTTVLNPLRIYPVDWLYFLQLHNLFRQGAFQGTTPRQAYFVKCDKETTTQNDIDQGIVNIVVGFAPLKPAEFVIIKLQQIAGELEV